MSAAGIVGPRHRVGLAAGRHGLEQWARRAGPTGGERVLAAAFGRGGVTMIDRDRVRVLDERGPLLRELVHEERAALGPIVCASASAAVWVSSRAVPGGVDVSLATAL